MADRPEPLRRSEMLLRGEHIFYVRESPTLKRDVIIYPTTLTPEQLERLNQIEQELIEMADEATEENRATTTLKGK
jgi:hypothetical protein